MWVGADPGGIGRFGIAVYRSSLASRPSSLRMIGLHRMGAYVSPWRGGGRANYSFGSRISSIWLTPSAVASS